MRFSRLVAAAVAAASLTLPAAAHGAAGDLDRTFAGDGVFTLAPEMPVEAVAVAPGGGVLSVNDDMEVVKVDAAGAPDTAFGAGTGRVAVDFDGSEGGEDAKAIAVDAQGRILVAGEVYDGATGRDRVAVARLLADGTPDPAFGRDGRKRFEFPGTGLTEMTGVAAGPGGTVVLAGHTWDAAGDWDISVARLTSDGTLDDAFAADGLVRVAAGVRDLAASVAVDSLGRVIVGGSSTAGDVGGDQQATVLRLTAAGSLDPGFDGDGIVRRALPLPGGPAERGVEDVAVDGEDRVVAAGSQRESTIAPIGFILRLTTAGALDPAFDDDGVRAVGDGIDDAELAGVAVGGDGTIVAAGTVRGPEDDEALAVRLTGGGAPDATFGGGDGLAWFEAGADTHENALDVALDAEGRPVVGGWFIPGRGEGRFHMVGRLQGATPAPVEQPRDEQQHEGHGQDDPAPGSAKTASPAVELPRTVRPAQQQQERRAVRATATVDRIRGRSPRRFSGRAAGTVRRVEVAVVRKGAKRVRWLRAKGTARWSLTLGRRLARGRYELRVRAVGADGTPGTATRRSFRVA
jgi:uncharacterized delta-60 repeat protein